MFILTFWPLLIQVCVSNAYHIINLIALAPKKSNIWWNESQSTFRLFSSFPSKRFQLTDWKTTKLYYFLALIITLFIIYTDLFVCFSHKKWNIEIEKWASSFKSYDFIITDSSVLLLNFCFSIVSTFKQTFSLVFFFIESSRIISSLFFLFICLFLRTNWT